MSEYTLSGMEQIDHNIIQQYRNRLAIQTSEALDYKIYGKAVSLSLFVQGL